MIDLYVASGKLTRENKDICVRLCLPAEKKDIWLALQKAEIETLDDCELLDVECEMPEVSQFLQSLDTVHTDVFKLNYFARLLSIMDNDEEDIFKECILTKNFQDIEQASAWIRDNVLE